MRKIDLAYLAGVMDSDGSFTIRKSTYGKGTTRLCCAYQELMAIGQCKTEAIYLLKELFGGAIRYEKPRTKGRSPMYFWQASNRIAVNAINHLLPFLRIKRRQAEIVLALRKIKDRGRKVNRCPSGKAKGLTLKPEVLAEMELLTRQIRELNDTRFPLALNKQE